MADFARRIVAACPGLGWEADEFLADYEANQQMIIEDTLEHDPLAAAVMTVINRDNFPNGWKGTASELLDLLDAGTPDNRKGRFWPGNPRALGSQLRRIQESLASIGYRIQKVRRGRNRFIAIAPPVDNW